MNLRDKNTKNLVIWDPFHIMYCLIWKICRQKLKKMYQIKYCNYYRISTDIKIVFFSLKVGDIFSAKKSVSKYPRSFVYCRFICPDCNASFVSESIYLTMRIKQPCETHSELIFLNISALIGTVKNVLKLNVLWPWAPTRLRID